MKIKLLGTGTSQGVPVIGCQCEVCRSDNLKDKRLRTAAMIEWDQKRYVFDCGPDFRTQMLREQIDRIDGIFFTHEHADHTAGLDDIRPLYFKQARPVPIYALPRVIQDLQKRFDYIFTNENRYPGAPRVKIHQLEPYQKINLGDKTLEALPVLHGQLPILAYKIDNIAYITDAKFLPDTTIDVLTNQLDLLIINSLHQKQHQTHFNLKEALKIIKIINPKQAILTHISHHMGLYEEISRQLPARVKLGYDGMLLEI